MTTNQPPTPQPNQGHDQATATATVVAASLVPPPAFTYHETPVAETVQAAPRAILEPTPPSLGITGKRRMPGIVIVLSAVTLGIYALVWYARVNREMSDFDTRMHVNVARSTWPVAIPWIIGMAAAVAGILMVTGVIVIGGPAKPAPWGWLLVGSLLLVPYAELFFPLSIVGIVMTAERVRVCQDRIGVTADVQLRPTAGPAWLLVPVVGWLVWMVRIQSLLNGVWDRAAPPASHRRLNQTS